MATTKTTKNIYKKLAEAKAEIGAISKDSTNPFFKSKYFDINNLLAHVEPILHKHGLVCLQPIAEDKVVTQIFDIDSEVGVHSSIPLPEINDPQKLGSAITYYRRYTLASLLALQAVDDDAEGAKPKPVAVDSKQWLNKGSEEFNSATKYILEGGNIKNIEAKYKLSKEVKELLTNG